MGSMKRSEAGITLVELLVAVSILMIISVTLFGAFETATQSWERGADDGAAESSLRLVLHEFDSQARSAVDEILLVDARPVPYFFGSSDTLRFLTGAAGLAFLREWPWMSASAVQRYHAVHGPGQDGPTEDEVSSSDHPVHVEAPDLQRFFP